MGSIVKTSPSTDVRARVFAAEKLMVEHGNPVETPIKHYFSQGVYAREMFIPKGTLLTGHIHKYQQLNIMSKGELSVLTEQGVVRVKAPFTIVSPPGTKRIAYAHEDTIWTTIHGTDETDVDRIEEHFIAHSEEEYTMHLENNGAVGKLKSLVSAAIRLISNKIGG